MCITRWAGRGSHRRPGRGEPRLEAGAGGQADVTRRPAGHLPCQRHPVAARVLRNAMAQMALLRTDDRTKALRDNMSELLCMEEPRKRFAAMMSGLGIRYDLGEGHPLLGRRMPDLDVVTADGPVRVFTLLHEARPVLLNLGGLDGFDTALWADRVRSVDAKYAGARELPALGPVPAPGAVLIRPDGYVTWAGERAGPELHDALTTWFGPPSASQGIARSGPSLASAQSDHATTQRSP